MIYSAVVGTIFILLCIFVPLIGKVPSNPGTRKQDRDSRGRYTNKPLRFYGKGDLWI